MCEAGDRVTGVVSATLRNVNIDIDPNPHLRALATCRSSWYIPEHLLASTGLHAKISVLLSMIKHVTKQLCSEVYCTLTNTFFYHSPT